MPHELRFFGPCFDTGVNAKIDKARPHRLGVSGTRAEVDRVFEHVHCSLRVFALSVLLPLQPFDILGG